MPEALAAPSGLIAARSCATQSRQGLVSCPALSLEGDTVQTIPLGLSIA